MQAKPLTDTAQGRSAAKRRSSRWLTALVAVFAVGLVSAPGVSAERGVVGYFEFPRSLHDNNGLPGTIQTADDIDVNATGTGGAAPEDLYVLEDGGQAFTNHAGRIQQFSSSGDLKSIWGIDVVAAGPNNADETQAVRVQATGGTFTLTFGGDTTTPIAYDAPAATVEGALNVLGSIGGVGGSVNVTGGPGDAAGATPYLVSFSGIQGGADQPLITPGDSQLTGPGAGAFVATTNPGGIGYEICRPEDGDVCKASDETFPDQTLGGGLGGPAGLAIDQQTGSLYVTTFNRINKFSAEGDFLQAFGFDTVFIGPNDSDIDERQELTTKGTGGSFTLSFFISGFGEQITPAIPLGASPQVVEDAINDLAGFQAVRGAVQISSVLSDPQLPPTLSTYTYEIAFDGTFAGDDTNQFSPSATNLSGAGKSANVVTLEQGGALENCTPSDACQFGESNRPDSGSIASSSALAVAPADAPNAGNVLTVDRFNGARVVEFTADGEFVRLFGWNVDADNPSTGFEVCTAASGNECKQGSTGAGVGQFPDPNEPSALAIASDGSIYTAEGGQGGSLPRVQKFTPSGGTLVPSIVGSSETQSVTVNASAGQFRLGSFVPGGTTGTGTVFRAPGVTLITDVTTTTGEFVVGQPISGSFSGGSIGAGTTIAAVGPDSITLSRPISVGNFGISDTPINNLTSTHFQATGDLAHDIPASGGVGPIASLENALNAMPQISAGGGAVSVTGGPGDAGGSSPYEVVFDGGPLARTDPPELMATSGGIPLSGGSGVGANEVVVQTPVIGGPGGRSSADGPIGVAVGPGDEVFVAKRYPLATSRCPDGTYSHAEVRIQELSADGTTVLETSRPCTTDVTQSSDSRVINAVPPGGLTVNMATGEPYLVNDVFPVVRSYIYGPSGTDPDLTIAPLSDISAFGATVSGEINPNGPGVVTHPNPSATRYRVEYKKSSESAWDIFAPEVSIGTGMSFEPLNVGVSGLDPKTSYDVRVVARKPFGYPEVIGPTQTFTTLAAPPAIEGLSSSDITATSANLNALVNPRGTDTTYHFEYGTTPNYGNSTPEIAIGDSLDAVPVQAHIDDLSSAVYHFRVVATNSSGTAASANQTFNFYPEPCPNATVRQQTGSGELPDCRAYELVSPGNAGAAIVTPGGPYSPHASNPPRFGYFATASALPGPWNPNTLLDSLYVATREASGWETNFVGIPADVSVLTSGQPLWGPGAPRHADRSLSRFLEWSGYDFRLGGPNAAQMAPRMFDWHGNALGRLPTNLEDVPGGEVRIGDGGFVGDVETPGDFSHYFFSSANLAFAPGGLTSGVGSAYANHIEQDTIEVISKRADGSDIPPEPGDLADDFLTLPSVSVDGSHVLMGAAAFGVCGNSICGNTAQMCSGGCEEQPSHLYMRVNKAITYDVSDGYAVNFEGMTDDGSKVLFTSAEQITPDDSDTSIDLFQWTESTDAITRLSTGPGGVGDTDACNAAWVGKCGVAVVTTGSGRSTQNSQESEPSDNAIGRNSGDVYFYSPEQFVGANGIPGRRNLYMIDNGDVKYVATLDADKPVTRLQVSPDGTYGALVTASRITAYDNAGFEQMYLFESGSERLRCVSCVPSGESPTSDVTASYNGIFLSDDGRPFFSTEEALVPRDTNGLTDVYEYVGGRPRLISSGVAASDEGAGIPGLKVGLIGVSANGVDVYFWTREKLVSEDQNGSATRIYNARTNGGFPVAAGIADCEAADECHGPASNEAVAPRVSTGAALGGNGNVGASRCAGLARRTRLLARRARVLRLKVRRMARAASGRNGGRRVRRVALRARKVTRRARRTRTRVATCRRAQRKATVERVGA